MFENQEPPPPYEKDAVDSWKAELERFKYHLYPMFKEYGFTLPQAMLIWRFNGLENSLCNDSSNEDDEPWKK